MRLLNLICCLGRVSLVAASCAMMDVVLRVAAVAERCGDDNEDTKNADGLV